jgi:hypothetical protein
MKGEKETIESVDAKITFIRQTPFVIPKNS